MKKIVSVLLCLVLLTAVLFAVDTTENTTTFTPSNTPISKGIRLTLAIKPFTVLGFGGGTTAPSSFNSLTTYPTTSTTEHAITINDTLTNFADGSGFFVFWSTNSSVGFTLKASTLPFTNANNDSIAYTSNVNITNNGNGTAGTNNTSLTNNTDITLLTHAADQQNYGWAIFTLSTSADLKSASGTYESTVTATVTATN